MIERTSADFALPRLLEARARAQRSLQVIASRIQPGMTEEAAHDVAKAALIELGAEKQWHRPLVRFGVNTLKGFSDVSVPGVTLGADDIFFVDIGPVWGGYEGDVGDTFVTGEDPEMMKCAVDARVIFDLTRAAWREQRLNGQALYAFASQEAARMGWALNLDINGHRLSEFPHQVYYKGGLGEVDLVPAANLWVLEIQIRHPRRDFGAFYEDLLIS